MLWNRIVLVATIFVVSMSFSVSNRAPALTQSVNVPSEEGHSLRSLRSSDDAGAGASTELVSSPGRTLDDTLDETSDNTPDDTLDETPREIPHADEEREAFHYLTGGLLKLRKISSKFSNAALIRLMRFKAYYDDILSTTFKFKSYEAIEQWYKREGHPYDKVLKHWAAKGFPPEKLFKGLKMTTARSFENDFKYIIYLRYCRLINASPRPQVHPYTHEIPVPVRPPDVPEAPPGAFNQAMPELIYPPSSLRNFVTPNVKPSLGVREEPSAPYLDHPSSFKTHDHVEPPIAYPVVEPVRGPV